VAAASAAVAHGLGQLAVEEDDGLGSERPVLGGAEGEHVDARLPGHLGRRAAERSDRVGESRTVHVHAQPGIVRDATDRFEIVRVLRRSDGCDVLLRQFAVVPLWAARSPRQFHYVLRNAGRGEAIAGDNEGMTGRGELNFVGALFGLSVNPSTQAFSVWSQTLRYPTRASTSSSARRIDPAWLDGAELVVIESVYAGRVTRPLDVDGFKMRQ
jgi:hypothetical protein